MPRILLVEDEEANRDLFRRRLERKGHAVAVAETGLRAVELAKSEKPDLVLMDLGLPDIDGWEATRRLKADPATAETPVIVLSAHASAEARQRAFASGCEEFETKPVNWEVLFKKIDDALRKAAERAMAKLVKAADEIDLGSAGSDSTVTTVLRAPQGARILVVEDNDANRQMLCRRLHKHGHSTAEAADGAQALEALKKQKFDLVLCDIMMPGVDGFEVLRRVKADLGLQPVPVIMISAVDETASVVRCIEMGAEDYLQKPYDPVLLQARVAACLERKRQREQEVDYLRAAADLARAAEAVEQGKFDSAQLAPLMARDDALGTLARVFDRMARELQGRRRLDRERHERAAESRPGADTVVMPTLPKPPNS